MKPRAEPSRRGTKIMSTSELVFMKQLIDNAEFANENGVLNVLKLFKHEDPGVRKGTSFAAGAFDTLQRLIDLRPELFTANIKAELKTLSQDSEEPIRSAANIALARLSRHQLSAE
jgi:hypothetical protein